MLRKIVSKSLSRVIGAISHVKTQRSVAALTFDDGPDPHYTPRLLKVLADHKAGGTFFMVGEAAAKYPSLVKEVAGAGHVIGNHSWDHRAFPLMTSQERRQQMRACSAVLAPYESRYLRPPFGEQNFRSCIDTRWMSYDVVGWSVDVGDWWNADASMMTAKLVEKVRPGSIVLLHDAIFDSGRPHCGPKLHHASLSNREPMLTAVRLLLEQLSERMQFVTISDLLAHGRPLRRSWNKITAQKA